MDKEKVYQELAKKNGIEFVKKDEPMCKHTSFKIGGTADIFVSIKKEEDLLLVLKTVKQEKCNFVVFGNGTNLLVKDNGIRGIVAKIELEEIQIQKQENNAILIVGAGAKNAIIAQKLLQEEIAGFEFAAGIPGTIGGAVYMNAGAYGGEIKDFVKEVTYMDKDGVLHTIKSEACKFNYRFSIFSQMDVIITKVKLEFPYGKKEEIKQKMEENAISRKEKQPLEMPSAGSTFKRGKDFITAKLIDECGLKGYKVGEAQVSQKHAGFVVNCGNATAKEVIDLIEQVQKIVLEKTGKQIELEIKVIGE